MMSAKAASHSERTMAGHSRSATHARYASRAASKWRSSRSCAPSLLCKTHCFASARAGTYILSVVGPDSVAACRAGAPIAFRIDGKPATQTSTNSFKYAGALDLTQA